MIRLLCCILPAVLLLASCTRNERPSDFEVWGIDLSKHQRRIDWEKVRPSERPAFVFLKATEGLLIVDPTYDRRARELNRQGIPWGAYHFFGHRTSGRSQARHFIRTARLERGNLHPVLDIEPHRFMRDADRSVREARAFCREIKHYYGVNPIIYSSSHFYERYLREAFPAEEFVLWIADYTDAPHEIDWTLWQHTDAFVMPGIGGPVDRNVLRGSPETLHKLVLR